jgi:molybdenum ABC transporter molybdate-binding protein
LIGERALRKSLCGVVGLLFFTVFISACQKSESQAVSPLTRFEDLAGNGVRIGIVDPDLGPAGRYAVAVLEKLKLSDAVAAAAINANIVTYESQVRALLDKIVRHEVDAGFIYRSDAKAAADRLHVIEIPASFSVSPEYALARIKGSLYPEKALNFIVWLMAPAQREIWVRYGFKPPLPVAATKVDSPPSVASATPGSPIKLTVFAAAVFYDVVRELAQEYKSLEQIEVVCEFAGSGKLYQKIEQGAQGRYGADIFLSAAPRYVVELEKSGLADHRQIFMRSDLVVGVVKP